MQKDKRKNTKEKKQLKARGQKWLSACIAKQKMKREEKMCLQNTKRAFFVGLDVVKGVGSVDECMRVGEAASVFVKANTRKDWRAMK